MKRRVRYTSELGAKVASVTDGDSGPKFHIIVRRGKWLVLRGGNIKTLRIFPNQELAIEYGKMLALKHRGSLILHSSTGDTTGKLSFEAV